MSSELRTTPAIACAPGAIPASERTTHFSLAAKLFNETAISRSALDDGYEFQFPTEALVAVAQFVMNERLCCPFMRFDIEMQAGTNVLVLRMSGPAGTREVLEAELHIDQRKPSGCGCRGE